MICFSFIQTSELLFGCRKLTASEALHFGLVTRILWPDKFQEELIPIIRSMASQSAQVSHYMSLNFTLSLPYLRFVTDAFPGYFICPILHINIS